MKSLFLASVLALSAPWLASPVPNIQAQDVTLDQLLKKLPPPETLVKNPVKRALDQPDPALKDPLVQKIAAADGAGDFKRLLDLTQQLTKKYPRSTGSHSLYGAVLLVSRNFSAAETEFDQAVKVGSKFSLGYFFLGVSQSAQRHFAPALANFQKVASLEPEDAVAFIFISGCEGQLGRKEEALQAVKRATTLSPAFLEAWLQLAVAEKAVGHTSECLHALTRAADLSPDSAYMLEVVGYSYINLNRIPDAIPPLERAAHFVGSNDYLLQAQLGFCLEETGQVQAGIDHLHRAVAIAPGCAPAWEYLGLAYQKLGKHREAVSAFERATHLLPNYKLAWQHLAEEYRLIGRTADAQQAEARAQSLKSPVARPAKKKK